MSMHTRFSSRWLISIILSASVCLLLFMRSSGPDWRVLKTQGILHRLAGETTSLVITSHELPSSIDGLVLELNKESAYNKDYEKERLISYAGIEKGLDAWGRELIVEVRDGATVSIRSTGRNGK